MFERYTFSFDDIPVMYVALLLQVGWNIYVGKQSDSIPASENKVCWNKYQSYF